MQLYHCTPEAQDGMTYRLFPARQPQYTAFNIMTCHAMSCCMERTRTITHLSVSATLLMNNRAHRSSRHTMGHYEAHLMSTLYEARKVSQHKAP